MTLLIRNARILTMDDDRTEHACADLLIEGTRIARIGAGLSAPEGAEIIDAEGKLAMPGLINSHFHSGSLLFKGLFEASPLELIILEEDLPGGGFNSGRFRYLQTMLGAIEMLTRGITSVRDDTYFIPTFERDAMDGVFQAWSDAGMRAQVAIAQNVVPEPKMLPFLNDLVPDDIAAELAAVPADSEDDMLARYRDALSRWHGTNDDRIGLTMSGSAPQRCTDGYLQALSAMAREHDLSFDLHVYETKTQRVMGEDIYGQSLVAYLDDLGVLDEHLVLIHAVWTDQADWDRIAAAGSAIAHNPISNLKLGSGIAPFPAWMDAGIPVGLGTDEASTNDTANLWQVAKTGCLLQKVTNPDPENWPRASAYLDAVTRSGGRLMRRKTGQLAPGFDADVILVDLSTLAFTPLHDAVSQLIYCEDGTSVQTAIVAGEVVMQDGKLTRVDQDALLAELREAMPEWDKAHDETRAAISHLLPWYRQMYLKAAGRDVGFSRWLEPASGADPI
ncbi:MAG: amidohydrolase family protein [Rhodospirillaceae bacterium]|jgi:5-methylthioadenosine/S-adenosylhomocysteine deaminase|nr:amidohydrolase family protein [Rhodospirillaceae bacterium]MBT6206250.1 amidohydrolase family protein [Rhodospirillaceae bacterium]MBT6510699.1 amidohydrolase family protein [Rhodospirillaceae bacterium]MBT7647450.1 amidohydrolase family protein [Rhodospirillaceae bacterium]